jgi:hypothetical protein
MADGMQTGTAIDAWDKRWAIPAAPIGLIRIRRWWRCCPS